MNKSLLSLDWPDFCFPMAQAREAADFGRFCLLPVLSLRAYWAAARKMLGFLAFVPLRSAGNPLHSGTGVNRVGSLEPVASWRWSGRYLETAGCERQ
jgi:hypothetical protein